MLIYRYEHSDGGGPFFYPNGKPRVLVAISQVDPQAKNYLFGCNSIDNLKDFFKNHVTNSNNIKLLQDCIIKVYDIPDNEVHYGKYNQIKFPQKYANKGVILS